MCVRHLTKLLRFVLIHLTLFSLLQCTWAFLHLPLLLFPAVVCVFCQPFDFVSASSTRLCPGGWKLNDFTSTQRPTYKHCSWKMRKSILIEKSLLELNTAKNKTMSLFIERIDEADEDANKSPVQIKIQLALGMEWWTHFSFYFQYPHSMCCRLCLKIANQLWLKFS